MMIIMMITIIVMIVIKITGMMVMMRQITGGNIFSTLFDDADVLMLIVMMEQIGWCQYHTYFPISLKLS